MARAQLKQSVDALLADGEATEDVVLMQQRERWALVVGIAAFIVVVAILSLTSLPRILVYGLAGASLGISMAFGTRSFLLTRTSKRTLLCESSRWKATAEAIVEEIPPGTVMQRSKSLLNDTYELGERTLIASRMFRPRIDQIVTVEAR